MAGIIRSPKRAKSERVVELVIGNMSGWILQDVGSVARPWEHPLFWGGGPRPPPCLSLPPPPLLLPLVPPTSGSDDDGGRGEAGIKLSFILAGTLTLYTVRKVVRPGYTLPRRSALLILGSVASDRLISTASIGILTPVIMLIRHRDPDTEAETWRSAKYTLLPL